MDEKKVREAIKYFKKMLFDMEGMGFKYIPKYYETAIEALEKQLPQKVEVKEWSPARCPSCGTELSESLGDGYYMHPTFLKRCPNVDCSQLLDWSE